MSTQNIPIVQTMIAGEDLTGARHTLMKITCWDDPSNSPIVQQCDVQGEKMCGVLLNNPRNGLAASVGRVGKAPVIIAEALACQRSWTTDANGHAEGAAAGDWVGGMVHEPGVLSPTPTGHDAVTLDIECLNPWHAHAGFAE